MTRLYRILSDKALTAAEPPEAVTVESDFVVILAALLGAAVCILGLIAVARCTFFRRGSIANSGGTPNHSSANKGLKKKVIEVIPKFKYDSAKEVWTSTDCVICLTEYANGDEIRVLPQCGHGFHVDCIDMWLSSHSSCPSCRQVLVPARCIKCGEFPTICDGKGNVLLEIEDKRRQLSSSSSSSDYLP